MACSLSWTLWNQAFLFTLSYESNHSTHSFSTIQWKLWWFRIADRSDHTFYRLQTAYVRTPEYALEGYSKNFGIFENLSGLSLAILSGLELAFWSFVRNTETASSGSQICLDRGKQPPQSPKIVGIHPKYLILLPDNRTTSYMKKESETINSVTGRLTAGKWIKYVWWAAVLFGSEHATEYQTRCIFFQHWSILESQRQEVHQHCQYFFFHQEHYVSRVVGRCQKANWQCQLSPGRRKKTKQCK